MTSPEIRPQSNIGHASVELIREEISKVVGAQERQLAAESKIQTANNNIEQLKIVTDSHANGIKELEKVGAIFEFRISECDKKLSRMSHFFWAAAGAFILQLIAFILWLLNQLSK